PPSSHQLPSPAAGHAAHPGSYSTGITRPTIPDFAAAQPAPAPFETRTMSPAAAPAPPAPVAIEPSPDSLRLLQLQAQALAYASQITASVATRAKQVQVANSKMGNLSDRLKRNEFPPALIELLEQIYGDILNNNFQWAHHRFTQLAEKHWDVVGAEGAQALKRLISALMP
ncbi:MAG: hypothetical protein Q8P67_00510, partial [archaeon]|nr:hypothetical protein [archaeon]